MPSPEWIAFWDRIVEGIPVSERDNLDAKGPEAEIVRCAITQQEAEVPRGWPWQIEILLPTMNASSEP